MTPAEAIAKGEAFIATVGDKRAYVDRIRHKAQAVGMARWFANTVDLHVEMFGPELRAACNSREFKQYVAGILGMC